ncbi:hypothetical protein Goshw_013515 [Gossypium schwendimanii]|uniref:Uncharacterized protein n=1 Tax=Gossypium schwendimanii TaxID=34291 RepID=A0A7J9N7X8_GOSSC|nr:hypothetical protein [Gossypium schwendimanii]
MGMVLLSISTFSSGPPIYIPTHNEEPSGKSCLITYRT